MAPVYDVVCTMSYPAIDQRLSIAFGGVYTLEGINDLVIRKCARTLHIAPSRLMELIDEITTQLLETGIQTCLEVSGRYGEMELLDGIADIVSQRCLTLRECVYRK